MRRLLHTSVPSKSNGLMSNADLEINATLALIDLKRTLGVKHRNVIDTKPLFSRANISEKLKSCCNEVRGSVSTSGLVLHKKRETKSSTTTIDLNEAIVMKRR